MVKGRIDPVNREMYWYKKILKADKFKNPPFEIQTPAPFKPAPDIEHMNLPKPYIPESEKKQEQLFNFRGTYAGH
jgi:hypothetical protein